MTTTVNLEELLTNVEAAKLLGLKPNTLEIWRCQGKGPRFIKMGAVPQAPIRYLRSDVADWIAGQRFISTSAVTAQTPVKADLRGGRA